MVLANQKRKAKAISATINVTKSTTIRLKNGITLKTNKMSSKIIKQELDSFDTSLLELDEIEVYQEYRDYHSSKRITLLEMIKADNLGYHLNELKEIINEYDKQLK